MYSFFPWRSFPYDVRECYNSDPCWRWIIYSESYSIAYMIITRKQSFHSSLRCTNFIMFNRGKIRKANLPNLFYFIVHGRVLRCNSSPAGVHCGLSEEIDHIGNACLLIVWGQTLMHLFPPWASNSLCWNQFWTLTRAE